MLSHDIKTKRLVLKPMSIEYLSSTHGYASDPENTKYMIFLPNDTIEETLTYLKNAEAEWEKDSPAFYEFAIFYQNIHIGAVSLYLNENQTIGEFGWIINKRYQKQGYAAEAASALLEWAVQQLGLQHFIAHCDSENVASRRVMEKIGMVFTDEYGGRKNKQSIEERRECLYALDISEQ